MAVDYSTYYRPSFNRRYSSQDALAFAVASHLAYSEPSEIENQVTQWGFQDVYVFNFRRGLDIDTQGYIAVSERRVLTAFRGSESVWPDWLTNLQAVRDPGPWQNTKVHEGFQDAFLPSALLIGKTLGKVVDGKEIWITGHSLGAALAVLLTATLLENDVSVEGLYTFAAPRVGNDDFAEQLNSNLSGRAHYRVVNRGDLVPHLPPELFFSHSGTRKLLVKDGINGTKREWDRMKDGMWGWIGRMGRRSVLTMANPHRLDAPSGYLPRLLAAARSENRRARASR